VAKPTGSEIMSNIQAEDSAVWDQASQRPNGLHLFESDLAAAITDAWSDVEDGLLIATVPVSGGSSAPGGPLAGGTATLAAGMLASNASFSAVASKFSSSFPDGATPELLALVSAVAQGIGEKFPLWVAGYSATLIAVGGSAAWVPPAPPANPSGAPGPWTGGSIQAFPIAGGSSTGDQGMTALSLEAAIGDAADPAKLKQNENHTLQPALSALVKAIAKGFETTWSQWKAKTRISAGSGSGTAVPPTGSIAVGAVTSPQIG
jgi:hypothetical protein